MLVFRFSVSASFMYQFDTSSMPSGFACTASTMQSSRKRIVSASVRASSW